MRTFHGLLVCGVVLVMMIASGRTATITDGEAAGHAGESDTVCGTVASVYYASRSHAQPTFLDFGARYPHETFIAVVFGDARSAFGDLERLRGERVCVTGPIELYRGKPEIILHAPGQLKDGG